MELKTLAAPRSPAAKVLFSFMLGAITSMFVMLTYQEFIRSVVRVTTMKHKLPPVAGRWTENGTVNKELAGAVIRERYGKCNQTDIMCGGDTSWDAMQIEDAQRIFHKKMQTRQYHCKTRRRYGKRGDGGYEICHDKGVEPAKNNCLVYSFGINNEWSFDEAIRSQLGCVVHSFDPSMKQQDHEHKPGIHFHHLGIWGVDMNNSLGWPLERLSTIREKLGHKNTIIDVLKIDVEGAEWPALRDIMLTGDLDFVKQFILEIHTPKYLKTDSPMVLSDYAELFTYYNSLEMLGHVLYHVRDNNYCCLRFHDLVSVKVRGRGPKLCCYETFLVNEKFLGLR